MDFARRRKINGELSMIPMINVIFLLLIFFMVAGSIERLALMPMEIPVAESGHYLEEGPIEIVLGARDEVIVNSELVSLANIQGILEPTLSKEPETIITLRADARIPARRMIEVMNAVKRAGGLNLSLVTQSVE